jgi:hypothetical protein
MFRVKRKHRRAWTGEGRDSRAMRYNLYFAAILTKSSLLNVIPCIARRLGALCGLARALHEGFVVVG